MSNNTQAAPEPFVRPYKCKIWSWKHNTGTRIWYFRCRQCYDYGGEASLKWLTSGMAMRWEWAMADVQTHIGIYH